MLGRRLCGLDRLVSFLALGLAVLAAPAQEVRRHGLVFEQWVGEAFFNGARPLGYTQKWDFPAEVNVRHGGLPVNPKAIKWGTAVDLGDALRQFDIDEPFILLVGFWEQRGDEKHFVKLLAPRIEPDQWRTLWAPVTREDLEQLDALIKDRTLDYREARRRALERKNGPPFSLAVIQVHPKIDARGQRRLQCSVRFRDLFRHLAPEAEPVPEERPELWGVVFPGPIFSPPRRFGTPGGEVDPANEAEPSEPAVSEEVEEAPATSFSGLGRRTAGSSGEASRRSWGVRGGGWAGTRRPPAVRQGAPGWPMGVAQGAPQEGVVRWAKLGGEPTPGGSHRVRRRLPLSRLESGRFASA
jgi:hypothetical protein